MEQSNPIRVMLVEDHVILREGLRSILKAYSNIDIVGEAGDGAEAVSKVAALKPSVVLMDITLPRMDGVAATRIIKESHPEIAVVGLTHMTDGHDVHALLRAGASEVLSKNKAAEDVYGAIQRAGSA